MEDHYRKVIIGRIDYLTDELIVNQYRRVMTRMDRGIRLPETEPQAFIC